jgi:hypothetical protein
VTHHHTTHGARGVRLTGATRATPSAVLLATLSATLSATLLATGACTGAEREAPAVHDARAGTIAPPPAAVPATSDASGDEPPHRIFRCLLGDSAMYADAREDPETGDTVGVWITVWQAGDGIDGVTVSSSGNDVFTPPMPFSRVQLAGVDSLALDMPHADGADTTRLIARVSCDRLWGRQRTHRDVPAGAALYRRVY